MLRPETMKLLEENLGEKLFTLILAMSHQKVTVQKQKQINGTASN